MVKLSLVVLFFMSLATLTLAASYMPVGEIAVSPLSLKALANN